VPAGFPSNIVACVKIVRERRMYTGYLWPFVGWDPVYRRPLLKKFVVYQFMLRDDAQTKPMEFSSSNRNALRGTFVQI